jgi:hypothetical protein
MRISRWSLIGTVAVVAVTVMASRATEPPADEGSAKNKKKVVTQGERADALARAAVWLKPEVEISQANFGTPADQPQSIACKFILDNPGGTAPKFDCTLDSGERIRVKYGSTPEIPSEIASTRLLHALGFGTDTVMLVENVRCYGCPKEPFLTMKAVDFTKAEGLYRKLVNYDTFEDFPWALVERKHPARAIETEEVEGWAFHELDQIDEAKGGAPRAHVDALRLLAVFIAHWDNKHENQRLVCLSQDDWPDGQRCERPFAMLQDLGGDFGPRKVDLGGWRAAPIWGNRETCLATMQSLPYEGATFEPVQVTEAGRRHLASLLGQISDDQIEDLFTGARFDKKKSFLTAHAKPIAEWVSAFKNKVRQISDGAPCPQ